MSNSVSLQQIADDVFTAPQLLPESMASAFEAGFKAVLNNRPDFEGGSDQPSSGARSTKLYMQAVALGE
jgi:protein tyrosine phosphatase (PTP) superfamily phosphohydrolase (DUF442 family)